MRYKWSFVFALLPLVAAADRPLSANEQFFHEQVEPILVARCLECHGAERKGSLDLRTHATATTGGDSGPSFVPGEPNDSLLIDYVSSEEMPPDEPLTEDEIATLRQWIAEGAYFPTKPLNPFAFTTDRRAGLDWWSLKPLQDVAAPDPANLPTDWDGPIDRFIFAKLQVNELSPAPPASPLTLIRRASYDLTGLPPTPEEVDHFLADCKSETGNDLQVGNQAYAQLVARLLSSPAYGEHWGRHWLDVVRFGESTGFERNVIINNAWPFRDYVIRSFNEDKPFDQFTLEHLAGDALAPNDPDVVAATTFLVCGPYDNVGNQDAVQAAQIRANTIDDVIRATGETFLGLTVGCARCHDHKFDPIAQQDYYQLYATFAGVFHGSRVIATEAAQQETQHKKKPFEEALKQLEARKQALLDAVANRAEEKLSEYQAAWSRPPADRKGTIESFPPVEARYVRLVGEGVDANPTARTGYHIDEFEVWTSADAPRNVALAEHGAAATGRSRVAQDFAGAYSAALTIDGKFGARWLAQSPELTIQLAKPEVIERVVFSSDRTGAAGSNGIASFVCDYRIEVSLDGEQWTTVADSRDRQPSNEAHRRQRLIDLEINADEKALLAQLAKDVAEERRKLAEIPDLPSWWVGTRQQIDSPFHVFLGGNPQQLGNAVLPASLTTISDVAGQYRLEEKTPEAERRTALARWLTNRRNPLTPRVLANRVWHYHFGAGIVDTPSDFGYMGGRPTHPELLDWLAQRLLDEDWKLKALHKEIMLSQAYRQSSEFRTEADRIDGQSRYLWRFPPRRLSAEEIRDSILAAAGKLDSEMGGPGFRLYDYWEDNVATYVPLDAHGPETYRRSVYHQNARAARVDLMSDYDSPDCAASVPRRVSTTTPLQALTSMNHSFSVEMANFLSERLENQATTAEQIEFAFRILFSRSCDEAELTLARQFVEQFGLPAFCRAMFNANEFIYVN